MGQIGQAAGDTVSVIASVQKVTLQNVLGKIHVGSPLDSVQKFEVLGLNLI